MPYTNGPISYHVLSNPWDKDESLSLEESDLVKGVLKLAEELEDKLQRNGDDISSPGKTILDRCYAELRRTAKAYLGDEHGLYYDPKPPGIPFPKKEAK